jgi:phosphate starvation-inducible membrane PsiE
MKILIGLLIILFIYLAYYWLVIKYIDNQFKNQKHD